MSPTMVATRTGRKSVVVTTGKGNKSTVTKPTTAKAVEAKKGETVAVVPMNEAMLRVVCAGLIAESSSWRVIAGGLLAQGKLKASKWKDNQGYIHYGVKNSTEGGGKARQEYARLILEDGLTPAQAGKQVEAIFTLTIGTLKTFSSELKAMEKGLL